MGNKMTHERGDRTVCTLYFKISDHSILYAMYAIYFITHFVSDTGCWKSFTIERVGIEELDEGRNQRLQRGQQKSTPASLEDTYKTDRATNAFDE